MEGSDTAAEVRTGVLGPEAQATDDARAPTLTRERTKRGWVGRLLASRDFAVFAVAVLLFLFFSLAAGKFLTAENLINIVRQVSLLGIVAVGMTYLFVAGEFDLSVGSNYGFLVTLMAFLIVRQNVDPWLATGVVILLGMGIGLVNGLLVTWVGLPSFLATLGVMAALRGAANIVSGGFPISARATDLWFYKVIGGRFLNLIPNVTLWMLATMLVGGLVLAKTQFGYHVYATGGNREAARANGIPTRRIKRICFVLTGGLCGLSAALLFGWLGIAPFNTGTGFELRVIAAIIIGGAGLFGGRGTIFGSLVGALILGMMTNGLILLGVKEFWDGVVAGGIILLAGSMDLLLRRGASRVVGWSGK